jgi:starch-binding outer membrane protein, SusD/RagB family
MQTIKKQVIRIVIGLCCIAVTASSCNKFVDVDAPETSASALSVYTNNAQAAAVLTGMLGKMNNLQAGFASGRSSVTLYTGLTGDELEAYTASGNAYMLHYTNSPSMDLASLWNDFYSITYVANAAIEGVTASAGISAELKKQLIGEAKFMRAFLHFYLVNLYGDVPVITTTDYRTNQSPTRTAAATVYNQIIEDLTEARNLLSEDYLLPSGGVTTERFRPNKSAATAMLARVYLYRKDWAKAETFSSELIANTSKFGLTTPIADIFAKTSKEAIWQVPPTVAQTNTNDGLVFIRTVAPGGAEPVALTRTLVNAFTTGDQRKTNWVDSITLATIKYYFPKKYRIKGGTPATTIISEYLTPLRMAEQFLIRAEARTKLGNLAGANSAQSDINAIRTRAGLGNTTAATEADLLAAIEQERRIELFCEFGHRWFDLKRTDRIDAVMSVVTPLKGGTWTPDMKLFPLPRLELERNGNLRPQNPGYN